MRIHVDAEAVKRHMRDEGVITRPLSSMLRVVAREGQQAARSGQPASIANSIHGAAHGLEANVWSTHPAALPLDAGRRPGAAPPPESAIRLWLARKGIPERFAFVVARAIGRRGVAGRFFRRAALDHMNSRMRDYLTDLGRGIEREWRK